MRRFGEGTANPTTSLNTNAFWRMLMDDKSRPAFASPSIAKEVKDVFGDEAVPVVVRMRSSKDVSQFIRKVKKANDDAAKSQLSFD